MYKHSEYAPGDRIRIFSSGSWSQSYTTATVKTISASGQMTVDHNGTTRRFTASGREFGKNQNGYRGGPWIMGKVEAEERARGIREEAQRNELKRDTRAALDALIKLDPCHERAELIDGLRALADKLGQFKELAP